MATEGNNLSEYVFNSVPNGSAMTLGIVVSEWNDKITLGLLEGAKNTLLKHGVLESNIHIHFVPGAFELPLGAQLVLENKAVEAVICLGCVIQGETKHFDFVCEGVAQGIKDVSLKYNTPVIFGVLTDNTEQQSIDRSGGRLGNKGDEAAVTAIKMVDLKNKLGDSRIAN
ncbi:6,7-dimethyl-8-ribityllumazine synthase [Vicingaceae bacterium]|nr:6,7-dimethyl-8-ribityllumazine synthase [Vicingaceae bacterium]